MDTANLRHEKVLLTVLSLEANKGHLKWKVSDLARLSKVSRPLIYYHFGDTKIKILETCVDKIGEEFFGLTENRKGMASAGNLFESLKITFDMFMNTPALSVLYMKSRTQNSYLRDRFIDLELRYQKKIAADFPHLSSDQIVALHAMFHGLVSAPFGNYDVIHACLELLAPSLRNPAKAPILPSV